MATKSTPIQISIINQTTVLTDAQITPVVKALQTQVTRDFFPVYGIDAKLNQIKQGQQPKPQSWWLVLLDTSDQAGALGYHDLTTNGLPIAKVFVKSDIEAGASWSITASHELIEMLGDCNINLTVFIQTANTKGRLLSYELCDAPEADQYGYDINGIKVSDFVYPRWFGIPGSTTKFDHMDHIKHEFEILPGGYIGEFDVTGGTGWKQITSEISLHAHRETPKEGSRRERRIKGKNNWKLSTAHKC